jgi:hypothetical protein
MSLGLIITGVICVLLILVIYISTSKNRKKKYNEYIVPLLQFAEANNCTVTTTDIWNTSVIGIDDHRGFVFFIQKSGDGENKAVINLADVFRCKVAEISRITSPKEGSLKVFDRIDLVVTYKDKGKPDSSIEFYSSKTDRLTLAGELQMAEKWCGIINNKSAKLNK